MMISGWGRPDASKPPLAPCPCAGSTHAIALIDSGRTPPACGGTVES